MNHVARVTRRRGGGSGGGVKDDESRVCVAKVHAPHKCLVDNADMAS